MSSSSSTWMRTLFGLENDGLHVAPDTPGAYEWWYFDALSDDGRFALVAIFFLGAPMSPYYKAVVDGKKPLPQDWCGVFFSLHEHVGPARDVMGRRVRSEWQERRYAYNLYRNGLFAPDGSQIAVGVSSLSRTDSDGGETTWQLEMREPGLWGGTSVASARFTTRTRLAAAGTGQDNGHTWVCVAPVCRVQAECVMGKRSVSFSGHGYHDHNFGWLPWTDTDLWYWGRAQIAGPDTEPRHVVYYADLTSNSTQNTSLLFFDATGRLQSGGPAHLIVPSSLVNSRRNVYGFRAASVFAIESESEKIRLVSCALRPGAFSGGPFYERSPIQVRVVHKDTSPSAPVTERASGTGIGEAFRPSRLCGPIASRAIWTRLRRR